MAALSTVSNISELILFADHKSLTEENSSIDKMVEKQYCLRLVRFFSLSLKIRTKKCNSS